MGNDHKGENNAQNKPLKVEAFTALSDWSRLLITIASGILALSVTFFQVMKAGQEQPEYSVFLILSWGSLVLSIVFGCYLNGLLVGHLNKHTIDTLNAQDPKLMTKTVVQWLSFLVGIGFFISFGIFSLL